MESSYRRRPRRPSGRRLGRRWALTTAPSSRSGSARSTCPSSPTSQSGPSSTPLDTALPIRLAIVGDGPLRRDAELAASESRGIVRFFGHRHDLRPFLAAADLFILSSAREGLPFSLLEAMAMGLPPVVAVGGEGIEAAVSDAGLWYANVTRRPLARAVLTLATTPELRARLGRAARATGRRALSRRADARPDPWRLRPRAGGAAEWVIVVSRLRPLVLGYHCVNSVANAHDPDNLVVTPVRFRCQVETLRDRGYRSSRWPSSPAA